MIFCLVLAILPCVLQGHLHLDHQLKAWKMILQIQHCQSVMLGSKGFLVVSSDIIDFN